MNEIIASLTNLFAVARVKYSTFYDEYDAEWDSPACCEEPIRNGNLEVVPWWPSTCDPAPDFAGLAEELHPSLVSYYSAFWSGAVETTFDGKPVSLIFLWNELDLDRLKENLIGHVVAQRHNRVPRSGFFATTTASSDYYIAVQYDTGNVTLERPGYPPSQILAPTLAAFLTDLEPADPWTNPERTQLRDLWD